MKHLGLKIEAYKLIKEKLMNGQILPGERIREDLLADEFSMSRTPVREAINQLSAEGFVIQEPRKGIFATEFTKQELINIIEIRTLLESYAAKICCEKITEQQWKELEEIYINLKDSLLTQDNAKYVLYDSMFHRKIGQITTNKKLSNYINDIEDNVIFARRMKIYNIKYKYSEEESIKQHEEILLAIKNRDVKNASKAIEKNTREVLNRMEY